MSFKPVGGLIGSAGIRSKNSGAIQALKVRQLAKDAISRELYDFPGDLANSVKVKSYKNGVLTIGCPPLVATELQMRSGGLKNAINKALGGNFVKGLRFRVLWVEG